MHWTWQSHVHSSWSSTSTGWLSPLSVYTLTRMSCFIVGTHGFNLRALSHEPLQRLTCTNWGEFLRSVTVGSTWTTSEYSPQLISGSWSFSERKYALVDVIKHNAGAKMICNLGAREGLEGGGEVYGLRANDNSVCLLIYTPRSVPNAVNSTLSSPLPSRSMWVVWVRHKSQFLHSRV